MFTSFNNTLIEVQNINYYKLNNLKNKPGMYSRNSAIVNIIKFLLIYINFKILILH